MKVLIVEDDRALGVFLQKGLKLDGHDTEWVEDGEAALQRVQQSRPDLMVLDLSLPRLDGMDVLKSLRLLSPQTAVLVLTGRNNVEERVQCLNAGADDCLLKPFSFYELAARCRAILRRHKGVPQSALLQFAGIEMDLVRRTVRREGRAVELTSKEFSLLEFLLRKGGVCCSREELLREVWNVNAQVETNVVDVYINYLRKKLTAAIADLSGRPAIIQTFRGRGYCLIGAETLPVVCETLNPAAVLLARGA